MRQYGSGYNYGEPYDDGFDDIEQAENTDDSQFDDEFSSSPPAQHTHSRFREKGQRPEHRDNSSERYDSRDYSDFRSGNDYSSSYQSYGDSYEKERYSDGYSPSQKSGGRKFIILLLSFFITVNLVLLAFLYFQHNYAVIGSGFGNIYVTKINTKELDLGQTELTSFDGIERLRDLKNLDLRGLNISLNQYETIRSAVPDDCAIDWNITVGGQLYDSNTTVVSFSDATTEEIRSLKYLENLEKVYATGCDKYNVLKDLQLEMPYCEVLWNVIIDGVSYPSTTTELTLNSDLTPEQAANIKMLPFLAYIDASACRNYEDLVNLSSEMPNCEIMWKLTLADVTVTSTSSSVDLSGRTIDNLSDFTTKLSYLPKLTRINMCNCNLSNEQMGQLRDTFPDKKFIWIITFGNKDIKSWKVRTDTTIFSTLNSAGGTPYDQSDFAPLFLYCTDLVALDLGHNSITDISLISNLKELKYLIIGDNHVSDITPLASLKKLEYLESWYNDISDASPLSSLPNLYDIDLANNFITDLSPFYSMPQLLSLRLDNSLGADRNVLSYAQLNKLANAIPNCKIERYHGDAFRYFKNNPRYLSMKMAFSNYNKVIYFKSWDDVKYDPSFYN